MPLSSIRSIRRRSSPYAGLARAAMLAELVNAVFFAAVMISAIALAS